MENNWLNLINRLKRILISKEIVYHMKNKKKYLINLLEKDLLNFIFQKKRINTNNLIYKYKTEGMSPKDFGNYQNPIDLFKSLRDGNANPKEVLQN